MPKPTVPERPSIPSPPKRRSRIPLFLAAGTALACVVMFSLLSVYTAAILGVAFVMFAVIGLQYFVWGRWLGASLMAENDDDPSTGYGG